MYCHVCGSFEHDTPVGGSCPTTKQPKYVPQAEVVSEFTNPDAMTSEQLMVVLLTEIKAELERIRKMLATKIPPLW